MVDDDIEFNFEEKFIFGHQNFVNCCFKVQFGCGAKSNCLIADRTGILYFPIISEDGDVRIRQVDLKDVSNKNLAIASIYRVDHKDHCYLFISCEAKDGGRYSLITYCLSNLDISQGDTELLSWQIMDFPFKIMDAEYLTDNSQNSIILLCGSDRRIHLYHLDAQCIIRRKKKNDFKITPLLEEMLVSSRDEDSFLLTALPIRLFINKNTTDHTVSDILLGYSNGILLSFHDSIEIQQPDNEIEFIQEIPSFHGTSTTSTSSANVSGKSSILKNTEQISIKSDLSAKRKSRNQSSDDLAKLLEELNEADENEEILEIGSKSNDFDVNFTIPLPSITEESIGSTTGSITGSATGSIPKNKLQSEENVPQVIENNIEKNVLLFDGIVSCLCFYQIPLTLEITDDKLKYKNKNKNMSWIDPKPKKLNFMNCVVIGLASGSTLLVHFDDAEKPIEILPNYCHHGGVITMTQGYITNNDCQDIFFGFHDGTVILVKCEDYGMQDLTVSEPKLSKICFSVVWQTQLAFPILGLTYGQLLGRTHDKEDQIISLRKQNENNERENHNKNVDEFENNVDISGILHDQLAVVTTKSFHLFSLSYSEEKTADKVDEIDRLVEELSSMIK